MLSKLTNMRLSVLLLKAISPYVFISCDLSASEVIPVEFIIMYARMLSAAVLVNSNEHISMVSGHVNDTEHLLLGVISMSKSVPREPSGGAYPELSFSY